MILVAQDQALPTKHSKIRIEKQRGDSTCRLCGEREETIMHVLSECKKIAQTEYKKRHDKVATWTHWRLCQIYNLPHSNNWYEHLAETVIETPQVKILWDFNIQTDKVIDARRPDIVVMNKDKRESWIVDIAIPGDLRVTEKEIEKGRNIKIWQWRSEAMENIGKGRANCSRSIGNHQECQIRPGNVWN